MIQCNQAGGIEIEENSELSLWTCEQSYQTEILSNGPVGISAGLGSQVTLDANAQISGHTGPGVELWGKSQLNVFGANQISQNGTAGAPRSAGVVVDGNSEAYLRGGQISSNMGPGLLVLVNSSVDATGATVTGNSSGIITCDSSAFWVSNLASAKTDCRVPHSLGNRRGPSSRSSAIPDYTAANQKHAWYKSVATKKK